LVGRRSNEIQGYCSTKHWKKIGGETKGKSKDRRYNVNNKEGKKATSNGKKIWVGRKGVNSWSVRERNQENPAGFCRLGGVRKKKAQKD